MLSGRVRLFVLVAFVLGFTSGVSFMVLRADRQNKEKRAQIRKNLKDTDVNVVVSISYDGGVYTVETATGKIYKREELFFHIKTDSTDLGPYPNKPVCWESKGKHGLRLIVVFSSPEDLKRFSFADR